MLGAVRSPTPMTALAAGGGRRGEFDMLNIATRKMCAQQQNNPRQCMKQHVQQVDTYLVSSLKITCLTADRLIPIVLK